MYRANTMISGQSSFMFCSVNCTAILIPKAEILKKKTFPEYPPGPYDQHLLRLTDKSGWVMVIWITGYPEKVPDN